MGCKVHPPAMHGIDTNFRQFVQKEDAIYLLDVGMSSGLKPAHLCGLEQRPVGFVLLTMSPEDVQSLVNGLLWNNSIEEAWQDGRISMTYSLIRHRLQIHLLDEGLRIIGVREYAHSRRIAHERNLRSEVHCLYLLGSSNFPSAISTCYLI